MARSVPHNHFAVLDPFVKKPIEFVLRSPKEEKKKKEKKRGVGTSGWALC